MAERFGWNVALVRAVWAVLAALPVLPGAVVYLVLWVLVPLEDPPPARDPAAPPPRR